uniref:G protein-coupled receptor n=1 Tax=Panagrellus redivivus TaxID=6233 RepID=A0A7E4VM51_PANRE
MSFKYYILNQAIWAQCLELWMLLGCPVFLSPYVAGFTAGIFRDIATAESTYFFWLLGLCVFVHTMLGVCLSLFNRFVFVFRPNFKKYLHNKVTMTCIVLFHLFFDIFFYKCYNTTKMDHEMIAEHAYNDTGNLMNEWLNEQSLIYLYENRGHTRAYVFIGLVIYVVALTALLIIGIWFIKNVIIMKRTSKTLHEKSTFLLTTAIVQAAVFIVLLFIPSIVIAACWAFAIENSGNVVNIALVFFCLHGDPNYRCFETEKCCFLCIGQQSTVKNCQLLFSS